MSKIQQMMLQRLQEINKRGGLSRDAIVGAINQEERTVELSFSSETEKVERWFGIEVLGHEPGEINLGRMNNGAPLCWMHDLRDQRGVVVEKTARVDPDRIARCVVRFAKDEDGEKLFQRVIDRITTKVSVGYNVTGMQLVEERDGVNVWRITAWEPYEVSLVSAGADDDVGVGRSVEKPQEEPIGQNGDDSTCSKNPAATRTTNKDINTMKFRTYRDAAGNLMRVALNEQGQDVGAPEMIEAATTSPVIVSTDTRQFGVDAERARVRSLLEMGRTYGAGDLAQEHVEQGKTAEELQRAILGNYLAERTKKPMAEQEKEADIGMGIKDLQRYSMMNVIRFMANPTDAATRKAAAFELECSEAAQRQYGKTAKGVLIPADVLGKRAFNAGGAANTPAGSQSGQNIVATELLSGSFIDMLRHRTTAMHLGSVMGGLVGNLEIPKQTGGATAYWIGEGENAAPGVPTIGQIGLTPKTIAAYTDITRKLSQQSTPDAEGIVIRDLRNAMSQGIDWAAFYGSGLNNQPKGIKNYTGLNAKDFALANPNFAEFVAMESEVAADNADIDSMAYVMNAMMRGHCKVTPRFGNGTESTIWEPGGTVNGYRTEITNQIANGDVFFGNFADLFIGLWGGLDLVVDTSSLSLSGGLRLVVFQDVDFVLRRVESLCYGNVSVVA